MEDDLKQKVEDIKRARKWAREYFNAYVDEDKTPSTLIDPLTHVVEFPDVDRLTVTNVHYGIKSEIIVAEYRLAWLRDGVAWVGGPVIRPDIQARLYIDKGPRERIAEARKRIITYAILGALAREK